MADVTTIPNVELARVGLYDLSTGPYEFTAADLQAAVTNGEAGTRPRLKLGHVDPRFDGEPSIGVVANMRLSEGGTVLIGDLVNVPTWLAEAMPATYPGRSIEATVNPDQGLRITALALLGMTRPGIDTLADLELALAAAARTDPDAAGVQYVAVSLTQLRAAAQDHQAESRPDNQEEAPMTPEVNAFLVAQGLDPETATEDQINAASVFVAAGILPSAPEAPAEEPAAEADPVAEAAEEPVAEAVAEDPIAVAASAALEDQGRRLAAAEAKLAARDESDTKARRDLVIAAAVSGGRIAPAQREHYRSLLDIDEVRTTELIGKLAASVPLAARGEIPAEAGLDDQAGFSLLPAGLRARTTKEG